MCTFDCLTDAMGHQLSGRFIRNTSRCNRGGRCPEANCHFRNICSNDPLALCDHCKRYADQFIDYSGGKDHRGKEKGKGNGRR